MPFASSTPWSVVIIHSSFVVTGESVVILSPDGLGAAACAVAVDGGGDGDAAFGGCFLFSSCVTQIAFDPIFDQTV